MNKKFPATRAVTFILCEDVREEARFKLSFLGVFTADRIVVLNPGAPGDSVVAVLSSLAVVAIAKNCHGDFAARMRIVAPDGQPAFDEVIGRVSVEQGGTAAVAWKAQGFKVPQFGTYLAELHLDGKAYPFRFEIVAGPSGTDAAPAPRPTIRRRS